MTELQHAQCFDARLFHPLDIVGCRQVYGREWGDWGGGGGATPKSSRICEFIEQVYIVPNSWKQLMKLGSISRHRSQEQRGFLGEAMCVPSNSAFAADRVLFTTVASAARQHVECSFNAGWQTCFQGESLMAGRGHFALSLSLSLFLLPVRPSVCLSGCLSSMFQSSSPQVHGGCDEHARLVMVQGLMKCEGHIEVASHEVDILKIHVLEVCDPKPLHEVMHCRMLSMEQVRD